MNSTFRIAWITVRELLYERVFYLLLFFALISLGVSYLLGQMTYDEQLKLILDFMLAGIQISMILFSVFMGISLFHRELQLGSVFMVLSKPISRCSFLVGKFLGQLLIQVSVIAAMGLLTFLVCFRLPGNFSPLALVQGLVMIGFEAALIASLTYLFAATSGGMTTAVVTLCLFCLGHTEDTVNANITNTASAPVWQMTKALIPNLEIFNIKAYTSYGIMVAWTDVSWAFLYAASCIILYLVAAVVCFGQKDIT